jgi:hypothetical protein
MNPVFLDRLDGGDQLLWPLSTSSRPSSKGKNGYRAAGQTPCSVIACAARYSCSASCTAWHCGRAAVGTRELAACDMYRYGRDVSPPPRPHTALLRFVEKQVFTLAARMDGVAARGLWRADSRQDSEPWPSLAASLTGFLKHSRLDDRHFPHDWCANRVPREALSSPFAYSRHRMSETGVSRPTQFSL